MDELTIPDTEAFRGWPDKITRLLCSYLIFSFYIFSIIPGMNALTSTTPGSGRLLSLDFMRGLIMVFLAFESTGLYEHLLVTSMNHPLHWLPQQFFHHPWHGLRFWDLIQPGFMYMAGVALAFSLHKQEKTGMSRNQSLKKTLKRSGWLFFWGVLNYAVTPTGLELALSNVLVQLAFTLLIAFLIYRWSFAAQACICVGLLLLREALYRYSHIPGFDQPFTNHHNFGNYMDQVLVGHFNPEGWVSINWIPTAVHTIAGALTGKLLLSPGEKIKPMLVWGLICLILGYALDFGNITPIIKRIATSSFTLVSLGYVIWAFAACYYWIDVKHHRKHLSFFTIVGMNSIFIYLFFEIVGSRWFNGYVIAITGGIMKWVNTPPMTSAIISSICIFGLEWWLCYFLYRKKIFISV